MRRLPRGILAVGGVLLAVLMGAGLANERGDALGLVATAFYATLFVIGALRWDGLVAWGKRHPVADRALMFPLAFFAVALFASVPLAVCALIAAAATLVFVAVGPRRRAA